MRSVQLTDGVLADGDGFWAQRGASLVHVPGARIVTAADYGAETLVVGDDGLARRAADCFCTQEGCLEATLERLRREVQQASREANRAQVLLAQLAAKYGAELPRVKTQAAGP